MGLLTQPAPLTQPAGITPSVQSAEPASVPEVDGEDADVESHAALLCAVHTWILACACGILRGCPVILLFVLETGWVLDWCCSGAARLWGTMCFCQKADRCVIPPLGSHMTPPLGNVISRLSPQALGSWHGVEGSANMGHQRHRPSIFHGVWVIQTGQLARSAVQSVRAKGSGSSSSSSRQGVKFVPGEICCHWGGGGYGSPHTNPRAVRVRVRCGRAGPAARGALPPPPPLPRSWDPVCLPPWALCQRRSRPLRCCHGRQRQRQRQRCRTSGRQAQGKGMGGPPVKTPEPSERVLPSRRVHRV